MGTSKLYPSRSELVRAAVKALLKEELIVALNHDKDKKIQNRLNAPIINEDQFVQVPQGYKTYKLGRKINT